MSPEDLPDWERLLAAERHLQAIVPGDLLVGGTAAALHAGHRKSLDGDHVIEDLRSRFEEVLTTLEAVAGWQTSRVQRPLTILGRLGEPAARDAFSSFDEIYAQGGGASPMVEVVDCLAAAAPSDAPDVDLRTYKGLVAPWNDWSHLSARGRHWATVLAEQHLGGGGP